MDFVVPPRLSPSPPRRCDDGPRVGGLYRPALRPRETNEASEWIRRAAEKEFSCAKLAPFPNSQQWGRLRISAGRDNGRRKPTTFEVKEKHGKKKDGDGVGAKCGRLFGALSLVSGQRQCLGQSLTPSSLNRLGWPRARWAPSTPGSLPMGDLRGCLAIETGYPPLLVAGGELMSDVSVMPASARPRVRVVVAGDQPRMLSTWAGPLSRRTLSIRVLGILVCSVPHSAGELVLD